MKVDEKIVENRINLSKIDHSSETCHEIERYLGVELDRLRQSNDSTKLTEAETAAIRGRIKENRNILKQLRPDKVISTRKMQQ